MRVKRSNRIDDCFRSESISDLFANKYKDLYASVPFNIEEMADIKHSIRRNIQNSTYDHSCVVACTKVLEATGQINAGKDDGNRGLTSDHI